MDQESLFSQQSFARDPDITINRHRRSDTSMLAHKTVNLAADRELAYGYIKSSGSYGLTVDEFSILVDRAPNRVSGRFSELKKAGRIMATAQTRKTRTNSVAHVYVVAQ